MKRATVPYLSILNVSENVFSRLLKEIGMKLSIAIYELRARDIFNTSIHNYFLTDIKL